MTLSYPFHSGAAIRARDFIVFFSIARTIGTSAVCFGYYLAFASIFLLSLSTVTDNREYED